MKYFFLALSLVVLVVACNKTPDPAVPNRENMLRSKKWKITGGTITVKNPNGKDTALEYMKFVDTCYWDDFMQFDSLHFGSLLTGGKKCNPADPESRSFTWRVWGPNDDYIDLYDGFNTIFATNVTIEPYHFDTLEKSPLKLDTIMGTLDTTPGFAKQFIVLDTVRELRFTSTKIPKFDIYGGEILDFSANGFKLKFSFKTTRLDSTGFKAGLPYNLAPVVVPDTADYLLTISPN